MSFTENFSGLVQKFVGKRPESPIGMGGLPNFEHDLKAILAKRDYEHRLENTARILSAIEAMSNLFPNLETLFKRFPLLAPILILTACNFVPDAMANTGSASVANTNNGTQVVSNEQDSSASQVEIKPDDGAMPPEIATVVAINLDNPNSPRLDTNANLAETLPDPEVGQNLVEATPTPVPEIYFNTKVNVNIRSGPGTGYDDKGDVAKQARYKISDFDYRVTIAGLTWLRFTNSGRWVALVDGVQYDELEIKKLREAPATIIPVAPTRTPTRVAPTATPQPVAPPVEIVPTPAPIEVVGPSSQIFGGKGVEGHPLYATPYDLGNGGCSISPWVSGQSFSLGSIVTGSMTWNNDSQGYEGISFLPKIDFTALIVDKVTPQANGTIIIKVSGREDIKITNRTRVILGTTNHQNNPGYVDTGIVGPIQRFFVEGNLLGFHILSDGTVDYVFAKYPR